MMRRIFLLAAAVWIAFDLSSVLSQPVQTTASATDVYKSVYNGWKWWHVYCYRCHGMNAVGSTLAPNLSDPNEKITLKDFLLRVKNGSADGSMQPWEKLLDDKQITQLYYYVSARRDKVLPPGRPDEVGPKGGPWIPPKNWPKF